MCGVAESSKLKADGLAKGPLFLSFRAKREIPILREGFPVEKNTPRNDRTEGGSMSDPLNVSQGELFSNPDVNEK